MHIKSVLNSIIILVLGSSLVNASDFVFYPFWSSSDSTELMHLGQQLDLGNRYNSVSQGFVFDHCLSGDLVDSNKRKVRIGNAIQNASNQQLTEFITGQSPLINHQVTGSSTLLDSIMNDIESLSINLYYKIEMSFIENMIVPNDVKGTYSLNCEDTDLTDSSFVTAIEYSAFVLIGVSVTFDTAKDYHLLVNRFNLSLETIYNSDDLTGEEIDSLNNTSVSLRFLQFGGNHEAYQTVKNSINANCYFIDGIINSNCLSDLMTLNNYAFSSQPVESIPSFDSQLSNSDSSFFPRRVFMFENKNMN